MKRRPSARERAVSAFILIVLGCIAASMLILQQDYVPATLQTRPGDVYPETPAPLIAGLEPISAPERFDKTTLSDKINGKAELYLAAGFVGLETRRYNLTAAPDQWMEHYVYDMGGHANAFAVFSAQKRPGGEPAGVSDNAYRSANGLFFTHGRFYVEMIAATVADAMRDKMTELARWFVKAHPAPPVMQSEASLLPQSNRVDDTLSLTAVNTFGIDGFDRFYTARYQWNTKQATVFVSKRATPEEAADLARRFVAFFLEYGGNEQIPPQDAMSMVVIAIYDTFEVVSTQGRFVFGVHDATDLSTAVILAKELRHNIAEIDHGDPFPN